MKWRGKPWFGISDWFHQRFGCRVRKIPLTTPFGCPMRDGSIDTGGCAFCDENSAGEDPRIIDPNAIIDQLDSRIAQMRSRAKEKQKYMAYLQAGTNTHGTIEELKSVYGQIAMNKDIVAVSISTRPDCINEEKLTLIKDIFEGQPIWIELGVQTSNDRTLNAMSRGHTFRDSLDAIELVKKHGFFVSPHIVIGLPGDSIEDAHKTIAEMNHAEIDGIKFHCFSITRGSRYEKIWEQERFALMTQDEYIPTLCDLIEEMSPNIAIQRLVGGGRPEVQIAPEWVLYHAVVSHALAKEFRKRKTFQSARYSL